MKELRQRKSKDRSRYVFEKENAFFVPHGTDTDTDCNGEEKE
jgi:hypothetical protein